MPILDEPLVTEADAARELHVKPATLAVWRHRREGPAFVRVGKLIFYTPSALNTYVASRRVQPPGGA
jgi:hypothetical protein